MRPCTDAVNDGAPLIMGLLSTLHGLARRWRRPQITEQRRAQVLFKISKQTLMVAAQQLDLLGFGLRALCARLSRQCLTSLSSTGCSATCLDFHLALIMAVDEHRGQLVSHTRCACVWVLLRDGELVNHRPVRWQFVLVGLALGRK